MTESEKTERLQVMVGLCDTILDACNDNIITVENAQTHFNLYLGVIKNIIEN